MENYESIVNWTNKLGNTYNAKYIQACTECESLKNKGYNREEAEEILAGNGHGLKGLKQVLARVFGEVPRTAAKQESFIVPTSYDDILHVVEHNLIKDGPVTFTNSLTDSLFPIIEASDSYKKTILKLATACYTNPSNMKHLHKELKPYFEEIMLNAVLGAEQNSTSSVKKTSSNEYEVKIANRKAYLNLMQGLSSDEKFSKGNYAKFGLADEFLVKAHDKVSPYTRILKAFSN